MQSSGLITVGLPIALFIIMAGMGLSLTPKDFYRVVEQPRGVIVGTLGQMVLLPLIGFIVAALIVPNSAALAAGLVLVALCPGGTTSNLICYLARADLALSITLTVIASLLTILSIPPLLNLAMEQLMGDGEIVHLPFLKTLITMGVIIVLPTLLGMLVRRLNPRVALLLEPWISKFSAGVLVAIIIAIVVTQWGQIPGWIAQGLLPVIVLNFSALAAAFVLAQAAGLSPHDRITIMVELSLKNTTIGLLVALSLIGNVEMAIPSAIYGLFMYASAFVLVRYGRRNLKPLSQASFAG